MVTSSTQQTAKSTDDKAKPGEGQASDDQNTLGTTLMEIQKLISDIENPFTLVGKMISTLGKDRTLEALTGVSKEGNDREEQKGKESRSSSPAAKLQAMASPLLQALGEPASPALGANAPTQHSGMQNPSVPSSKEAEDQPTTSTSQQPKVASAAEEKPNPMPEQARTQMGHPVSRFVTEVRERIVTNSHSNGESRETSAQQQAAMDFMRYMNSIELANFLANRFGREGAIEVLGSYVKRNWIKEEIARSLLDATTILSKNDLSVIDRGAKEASVEDHRVALYLIEEYSQSLFSYSLSVKFQDLLLLIREIGRHDSNSKNSDYTDSHDLR